jgi:hypothetical protein
MSTALGENNVPLMSGNELMNVLRANCSKVLGQLLAMIRRLVANFQRILCASSNAGGKYFSSSSTIPLDNTVPNVVLKEMKRFFGELQPNKSSSVDSNATARINNVVSNGLIFLGRFTWLLKFGCDSVREALSGTRQGSSLSTDTADLDSDSGPYLSISEDQFRSAFEIADADGDGIIDGLEANETLVALSLEKVSGSKPQSAHNIRGTSSPSSLTDVVNLTYGEFVLLFGAKAFPPEVFQPINWVYEGLDALILNCHITWVLFVVLDCYEQFNDQILADFNLLEGPAAGVSLESKNKFLAFWIAMDLELEMLGDEKLLLPRSCSPAFLQFMFNISSKIGSMIISIDTFQDSLNEESSVLSEVTRPRFVSLIDMILHFLADLLLRLYLSTYDSLLHKIGNRLQSFEATEKSLSSSGETDKSLLQCLLDLALLKMLCIRVPKHLSSLEKLVQSFQNELDPVMMELVSSQLERNSRLSYSKISSLFCYEFLPKELSLSEQNGNDSGPNSVQNKVVDNVLANLLSQQNEEAMSTSRFTLLPIAMVTVSQPGYKESRPLSKKLTTPESVEFTQKSDKLPKPTSSGNIFNSATKWW